MKVPKEICVNAQVNPQKVSECSVQLHTGELMSSVTPCWLMNAQFNPMQVNECPVQLHEGE
jgi:hypothetical protein